MNENLTTVPSDAPNPAPETTTTPEPIVIEATTADEAQPASTPPQPPRKSPSGRSCWMVGFGILWFVVRWLVRHWRLSLLLIAGVAGWIFYQRCQQSRAECKPLFALEQNTSIEQTPEEIRALRRIAQWEFLAIQAEQLVEAQRQGVLGDDQLVRIYRGTLRLGIDMRRAPDDWFRAEGTTAMLRLPDITLLDANFINETHATTFVETGTWSAADKERLYQEAQQKMRARALTPQHITRARAVAVEQFKKILTAFGYQEVVINFVHN
mgnify:FL=1